MILARDGNTCRYCGFTSGKWQVVHHLDGDPGNNDANNLETICPMCNLICHAGQGCIVQGIVDLYEESDYPQNLMINKTRRMRAEGRRDGDIIAYLGLRGRMPFKMGRMYLRGLFGFVTSRKPGQESTQAALAYGYGLERKRTREVNRALSEFTGHDPEASNDGFYGDEGWEDAADDFYRTTAIDTGEPVPLPDLWLPAGEEDTGHNDSRPSRNVRQFRKSTGSTARPRGRASPPEPDK